MERQMTRVESPHHRHDSLSKPGPPSPFTLGVQLPKGHPPDPLRVLEPSKKKLHSLDVQRLMAVFEATLRNLEIVCILPFVFRSLERFSVLLGSELLEILRAHCSMQEDYQTVRRKTIVASTFPTICITDESGVQTDEETAENVMLKREESLSYSIKHSLRNILRAFRQNPKAVEAILGCKCEMDVVSRHLYETMRSLDNIVRDRLLTKPQEQMEMKKCLVAVMEREQKTNAIRERLEARYNDAVKDKQREIQKRNSEIAFLSNELSLIERMAIESQRRNLAEASKQCVVEMKDSGERQTTLREEILRLRMQRISMSKEFHDSETSLRKRKFKMATEVYNWIQKYDSDLGGKQEEFDLIEKVHDEEKKELAELETHFNKLAETYDAIMEERRLAQEEAERKEKELAIAIKGLTRLQAIWRGTKVRRILKGNKGKKGAKKGAKKGKKK